MADAFDVLDSKPRDAFDDAPAGDAFDAPAGDAFDAAEPAKPSFLGGVARSFGRSLVSAAGAAENEIARRVIAPLEKIPYLINMPGDPNPASKVLMEEGARLATENAVAPANTAEKVAGWIGGAVPTLAAAALTKNPAVGLTRAALTGGLQAAGGEAMRAEAAGATEGQAGANEALAGVLGAGAALIPGGAAKGVIPFAKSLAGGAAANAAQTATQNVAAKVSYDPNRSVGEGVLESAVAGMVVPAVAHGVRESVRGAEPLDAAALMKWAKDTHPGRETKVEGDGVSIQMLDGRRVKVQMVPDITPSAEQAQGILTSARARGADVSAFVDDALARSNGDAVQAVKILDAERNIGPVGNTRSMKISDDKGNTVRTDAVIDLLSGEATRGTLAEEEFHALVKLAGIDEARMKQLGKSDDVRQAEENVAAQLAARGDNEAKGFVRRFAERIFGRAKVDEAVLKYRDELRARVSQRETPSRVSEAWNARQAELEQIIGRPMKSATPEEIERVAKLKQSDLFAKPEAKPQELPDTATPAQRKFAEIFWHPKTSVADREAMLRAKAMGVADDLLSQFPLRSDGLTPEESARLLAFNDKAKQGTLGLQGQQTAAEPVEGPQRVVGSKFQQPQQGSAQPPTGTAQKFATGQQQELGAVPAEPTMPVFDRGAVNVDEGGRGWKKLKFANPVDDLAYHISRKMKNPRTPPERIAYLKGELARVAGLPPDQVDAHIAEVRQAVKEHTLALPKGQEVATIPKLAVRSPQERASAMQQAEAQRVAAIDAADAEAAQRRAEGEQRRLTEEARRAQERADLDARLAAEAEQRRQAEAARRAEMDAVLQRDDWRNELARSADELEAAGGFGVGSGITKADAPALRAAAEGKPLTPKQFEVVQNFVKTIGQPRPLAEVPAAGSEGVQDFQSLESKSIDDGLKTARARLARVLDVPESQIEQFKTLETPQWTDEDNRQINANVDMVMRETMSKGLMTSEDMLNDLRDSVSELPYYEPNTLGWFKKHAQIESIRRILGKMAEVPAAGSEGGQDFQTLESAPDVSGLVDAALEVVDAIEPDAVQGGGAMPDESLPFQVRQRRERRSFAGVPGVKAARENIIAAGMDVAPNTIAEWEARGLAHAKQNPDGVLDNFASGKINANDGAEVFAAQEVFRKGFAQALESNDAALGGKLAAAVGNVDKVGSYAGKWMRALRATADGYAPEAMAEQMMRRLFKPSPKNQRLIESGDAAQVAEGQRKSWNDVQDVIEQWKREGIWVEGGVNPFGSTTGGGPTESAAQAGGAGRPGQETPTGAEAAGPAPSEAANVRGVPPEAAPVPKWGFAPQVLRDPQLAASAMRDVAVRRADWADKALEWQRNMMLSNVVGQIRNFAGSGLNVGRRQVVEWAIQSAMNSTRKAVGAKAMPNTATWESMAHAYEEMMPIVAAAGRSFLKAWNTETSRYGQHFLDEGPNVAIQGKKGRVIRMAQRLNLAADEFWMTVAAGVGLRERAFRLAEMQGAQQGMTDGQVRALAEQYSMQPPEALRMAAVDDAMELTFKGQVPEAFSAMIKMKQGNKHPMVRLMMGSLFPFVKTPVNVVRQGVRQFTPYGLIRMGMKAARGEYRGADSKLGQDAAEQILGAAIGTSVLALMMDEDEQGRPRITGSMASSKDPGRRDFQGNLIPPRSIRIGDKWVSYSGVEPLATTLQAMTDMFDTARNAKNFDSSMAVMGRFMKNAADLVRDKTYLQQLDGLFTLYDEFDQPNALGNWTGGYLGSFAVPGFVRGYVRAEDPAQRSKWSEGGGPAEGVGALHQMIYRMYPSKELASAVKLDMWGNELAKDGGTTFADSTADTAYRMLMPVDVRQARTPTNYERMLFNYYRNRPQEHMPQMPKDTFTWNGGEFRFTPDEYREMVRLRGTFIQRAAGARKWNFDNPSFSGDIAPFKSVMEKASNTAREIVIRRRLQQQLPTMREELQRQRAEEARRVND